MKVLIPLAIIFATLSLCIASCTDPNSSGSNDTKLESTAAETTVDCERYLCVQDDPEHGATHKIGDVYLRIPRDFLQQPVDSIREADQLVFSVCWPGIQDDLGSCRGGLTDRIRLHLRQGRAPGIEPFLSSAERLAKVIADYDGPFRLEGTQIDEYRRRRNGVPVFFVMSSTASVGHYSIADCNSRFSCQIDTGEHHGLNFRYDFGSSLIRDWPQIDTRIKSLVASFIMERQ